MQISEELNHEAIMKSFRLSRDKKKLDDFGEGNLLRSDPAC